MFYYTPLSNQSGNEWIVETELVSSLCRVHEAGDSTY
jgi:hypothetical protein